MLRAVVFALALTPLGALAAPGPCLTPHLLPQMEPPRQFEPNPGRDKENRNPYSVPNELVTDDFVVRWGNGWTANQQGINNVAEALQDAWQTQIVDLEHPAPPSSDSFRINVYIGDTGSGAPSAAGAGGYFTPDDDGFPMLVVSQQSLETPDWTRVVALHEFYHAVQWGLDSYSYVEDSPGAWYWEATASWIPSVTDPFSSANGTFLFGFALLPHLPLDAFDYPDSGALDEFHQYGAFIFPTFLDESFSGPDIIRDSWVEPGPTGDPIEALRTRLGEEGVDFDEAFTDFVAANLFWDYTHGEAWEQNVLGGAQSFPAEDWVTSWVPAEGTDGFESAPTSRKPRRYGANVLRFDELDGGPWLLEAAFDAQGSQGSTAQWGVTLVEETAAGVVYQRLSQPELSKGVVLEEVGALGLAVGAWSVQRRNGERFDWSWSVTPLGRGDDDDAANDDDAADDDDATGDDDDAVGDDDDGGFDGSGCTCNRSRTSPSTWALALLALYGMLIPRSRRR